MPCKAGLEVCICDRCDAWVAGLPVGAEDEEGFNVGDQALGNLRASSMVTAGRPPNACPLTFKHAGTPAPATDSLVSGNSSWVSSTEYGDMKQYIELTNIFHMNTNSYHYLMVIDFMLLLTIL